MSMWDVLLCEEAMLHTPWFGLTLLFLVAMTLAICVTILYFVIRQNRSDKVVSTKLVEFLDKMSAQQVALTEQQPSLTERSERMTDILATIANDHLKNYQKSCTCGDHPTGG